MRNHQCYNQFIFINQDQNFFIIKSILESFLISFIITIESQLQGQMFPISLSAKQIQQAMQTHIILQDPKVIHHLSKIFELINKDNIQSLNLAQLSNVVKQTKININQSDSLNQNRINFSGKRQHSHKRYNFLAKNFVKQAQKLELAGISLGENVNQKIQDQVIKLSEQKHLEECRFWGKILGTHRDYYVIQAYRPAPKQHISISLGSQKPGQGVNYYTYFVTNDLYKGSWEELPSISIQHVRIARKIKKIFTGNLTNQIASYPAFPGLQKHYLKAQITRITHSLQLTPKGIYKPHDQNPKVIQYEQEVKIPQFSELSTLEGWVHKNQMILNLGRCTHFVDPSLPEDQLEAVASELAQKDPQIQRLRTITEDKPLQPVEGGPESYWIQKVLGNNQTFPKDEAQNVYAVSTLRNLLWPGWITVGYMNGYSNFYLGNGLKASQPVLNTFTNEDLQSDPQETQQFSQPNPKELPKVQAPQQDENLNDQGDD